MNSRNFRGKNDHFVKFISSHIDSYIPCTLSRFCCTIQIILQISGIADVKSGEVPKAYVVKKDENLTEEIVMKYVANKVTNYKQLVGGVEVVDAIPKSPSGKILRRILREAARAKETAAC